MIRITFENEKGKLVIEGGSHPKMNITQLTGFGVPPREFSNVTFAGQPGCVTTNVRDAQRTMTIGGTFKGTYKEILKIYSIIYHKGILRYESGSIKREIECRVINNDEFVEQGRSGIYVFALQFQADNPHFTDTEDTLIPIYQRKDLIAGSFSLPTVFTERITKNDVNILGELELYPTVIVKSLVEVDSEEESNLTIINETTGSFITLNHCFKKGEELTFDISKRKIVSSIDNKSIINEISDDTVLGNFLLEPGINHISVSVDENSTTSADVKVKYRNLYIAAVKN